MVDKKPKSKKQSNEPFRKFEDPTRKLLRVPKEELDEKRAEHERKREQEKR